MAKKKELTPDQMANFADSYFIKHFRTYSHAAEYFGTSNAAVSAIIRGNQAPNEAMLLAFGYMKDKVYKRVL